MSLMSCFINNNYYPLTSPLPPQVQMEGSGTSLAVVSCVRTEKSQRTISLSLWNMDASPSRAPMASTSEETREVRSRVMVRLSMLLLFGNIDPFHSGSSSHQGTGPASISSNEVDWPGNIFLPDFILVAGCRHCFCFLIGKKWTL